MGIYYYYLSTKTKRVFIDGKPEDVGLIMFSHKESWDNSNPKFKAARDMRLARNEHLWANREHPKYVMHAAIDYDSDRIELHQGDVIYHWDGKGATHFVEGHFMLMAGTLNILSPRRMEMQPYYTMLSRQFLDAGRMQVAPNSAKIADQYERLRAFLDMVPTAAHQTTAAWQEKQLFLHLRSQEDMAVAKLHFPFAVQFDEASFHPLND